MSSCDTYFNVSSAYLIPNPVVLRTEDPLLPYPGYSGPCARLAAGAAGLNLTGSEVTHGNAQSCARQHIGPDARLLCS
jgi:hypothetical protein